MVFTNASPFPYNISPVSTVQPFTYRDGLSFLEKLELMRVWLNESLVPEFNDGIANAILEFQKGIENAELTITENNLEFNEAFTSFVATINAQVALINNKTGPMDIQRHTLTGTYIVTIDPLWPDNFPVHFVLTQDSVGGHVVGIDGNINGPLTVNPEANSITVFTLFPDGEGKWNVSNPDNDTAELIASEGSATSEALNLKYVTKAMLELAEAGYAESYLSKTDAQEDYLSKTDAGTEYLNKTDAGMVYLTKADGSSTYPTKVAVASAYATKGDVVASRSNERKQKVRGGKTAFIGDSYMSGVQIADATKKWVSLYAASTGFVEHNLSVSSSGYVNEGVTGNSAFPKQAQLVPLDVDRVIISGGINDTSFSAAAIVNGVTNTISAIRTRVPNAEIIVISPMWWDALPSDGLLITEQTIRGAVPTDIRYIEGGPWIRFARADGQVPDGHPNELGSRIIAKWVEARVDGTSTGGALRAFFPRAGSGDIVVASSGGVGLAEGNVYDARAGLWELVGTLTGYGNTDGFKWVEINGLRLVDRDGLEATKPERKSWTRRVRHPGGNMTVKVGMTMNASINVIESGVSIEARFIED